MADIDGDGQLEVIVTSETSGRSSVTILKKGTGNTYNIAYETPEQTAAYSLAIGDCDRDGDPEIFFGTDVLGTAAVVMYNSVSGFTFAGDFKPIPGMGAISSIALADVDNDGNLDLAVAQSNGPPRIYSGGLGCVFSTNPRWTGTSVGPDPKLAFGDMGPDGKIELAVQGESTGRLYTDFNPSSWRYPSSRDFPSLPTARKYTGMSIADYPTNGLLDIILSSNATPFNSLRSLTPFGSSFSSSLLFQFAENSASTVCDFTGDGVNDAIAVNLTPGQEKIQLYSPIGLQQEWDLPVGGSQARISCGDVNGDMQPDLVVGILAANKTKLLLYRGEASPFASPTVVPTPNMRIQGAALADFNHDGFLDLLTSAETSGNTSDNSNVFINIGGILSGSAPAFAPNSNVAEVVVADVNGDGRLDRIFNRSIGGYAPELRLQQVDGSFGPIKHLPLGAAVRTEIAVADFTGDGVPDLFYGTAGGRNEIFTGDGTGNFISSWFMEPQAIAQTATVALGDIDNDGSIDILRGGSTLSGWLLNDGTGSFGHAFIIVPAPSQSDLALADFDGDGDLDAVFTTNGGVIQVFKYNSSVYSVEWSNLTLFQSSTSVVAADFNGDGLPDFVVGAKDSGKTKLFYYQNMGNFVFTLIWDEEISTAAQKLLAGDLDHDGDLDLIAVLTNGGDDIHVFYNTRNQPTQPLLTGKVNSNTPPNVIGGRLSIDKSFDDLGVGAGLILDEEVDVPVTIFDRESDPTVIQLQYWQPGVGWVNTTGARQRPYETSPAGRSYVLKWNAISAGVTPRQNVRLRVRVLRDNPTHVSFPIMYGERFFELPPITLVDSCYGVSCGGGTCVAGACYTTVCDMANPCVAPAVCYPASGTCGPADLCASANCPNGTVCYEGGCFPSCVDDGDCLPPFECVQDAGRCTLDACDGVFCPIDTTCFGGTCRTDGCDVTGCPTGETCYNTSLGSLCFDAMDPCANVSCSVGPPSSVCYEGGCFPACLNDVDCADTQDVCWTGLGCATPDDVCDDVVCPSGSVCHMGGCFPSCVGNADCNPPSICYDAGFCASPADPCDNVVCPSSYSCYEGGCFATCVDDGDCLPPNVCADSGVCINGNDPCESITCPVDDVCYQGGCYASCVDNGDCAPPFSLCYDASFCISTSDPCADVTCALGQVCHEGGCFEGCSSTDPCSPPLECFDDEYCNTENDACDGVICPASHICYLGGCFSNCVDSTDCGTPEICYGEPVNASAMSLDRCAVDACQDISCGEGEVCYEGGCFPTCVDDGDCSPPNLCFTNHCAIDPCDGVDCEIGMTCEGGGCFNACAANMDCPGYVGSSVRFIEVATAVNAATPRGKDGGIAWGDINNDGCLDFGVNTTDSTVKSRIYMSDCNLPNPKFTDVTGSLAVKLLTESGTERSFVFGDIDNDGDLDFAVNSVDTIAVYKNGGSAAGWKFTQSQKFTSRAYEGLAWIDYDGDKDLDLVGENSVAPGPVVIHRNDGLGVLTEIPLAGTGLPTSASNGDYGVSVDIDMDGDVDYILRKDGTSDADVFLNDGDGTWTAAASIFNQNAINSNKGGIAVCDFDNDGDFDIFWTDNGTNQIWRQTTPLTFVPTGEPAASSGVAIPSDIDDVVCGDLDHDGFVDVVLSARNRDYVFLNRTTTAGLAFVHNNLGITGDEDGEAITLGDYDNDGSLDLLINQDNQNELWRNPRSDDRYLMIAPQVALGGGITRSAIGATILIQDPDGNVLGLREINGGRGHGSQDPPEVHFGLRYGARIPYALTVTFPHGPRVTRCVVPNSIMGYQRVVIKDTDSDDLTACTVASATWTSLIELPSSLASGEFCFGDHCATEPCEGIQCSVGTACFGGNCNDTCTATSGCGANEICANNICVDDVDPTCDGGDYICPNEYECLGGDCYPECNADADCGAGELCYQGKCIVDDCTTVTCPSGSTCHHGICFGGCAIDSDCASGQACYDGRCAANGCAALDEAYDTNFLYRAMDRAVFATQANVTPFITPRVVVGAAGVDFEAWANISGGKSLNGSVPRTKTARVVLYLDKTKANGDNPDGRYVIWLQHGSTAAGQGASSATYRVHVKNPSGTPSVILNDDNESFSRIDTYQYVFQTTSTSGPSDTGGVAIGYLDSKKDKDWVVRVDAAFDGDLTRWEFYNPEGLHTALDPMASLTIKQVDFDDSQVWAREVGQSCNTSGARGICGIGTGYCEIGELRCQQTVFPWAFEVCDGRDNTCDGRIDEVDAMQYPEVAYRTSSSAPWSTWVTHDETKTATSFMNFTPKGGDDRLGSPAMVSTDGSGPMGAWDRSVITSHRNRRNGAVSLNIQMAAKYTNVLMELVNDYDAETRVRFTGSTNSVDELFVAWHDDREPGATSDRVPQSEEPDRFDLEWEIERTGLGITATREADGAVLQSMWSGAYSDLNELQARYYWTKDDNDNDSKPLLQWRLNAPYQPLTTLERDRNLYVKIAGVTPIDSTCATASPTAAGCQLSRYSCVAGVTVCGAADDAVCNRCRDNDGDGFQGYDIVTCDTGRDCNDSDPNIHPGADERCNGLDDDCDGEVDVKDNAAYAVLWNEPVPAGSQSCPPGDPSCGPKECRYAFACVCPDGPEDPADPPAVPCRCGEGLESEPEASNMSVMPTSAAPNEAEADMDDSGCSATGGAADVSWLLLLGLGLIGRRRQF